MPVRACNGGTCGDPPCRYGVALMPASACPLAGGCRHRAVAAFGRRAGARITQRPRRRPFPVSGWVGHARVSGRRHEPDRLSAPGLARKPVLSLDGILVRYCSAAGRGPSPYRHGAGARPSGCAGAALPRYLRCAESCWPAGRLPACMKGLDGSIFCKISCSRMVYMVFTTNYNLRALRNRRRL